MQKVFMTAKEVQDFLEVSRTTAYQLINEMNQELMNLTNFVSNSNKSLDKNVLGLNYNGTGIVCYAQGNMR